MVSPDQKIMLDILAKQRENQLRVDRVLKIVMPVTAFLLTVICANMNIGSTLFTFVMLWVAFYAVGIKQWPLWLWAIAIFIYCLIDNILSHGVFKQSQFGLQFGSMFIFLGIFGVGRRYFDRWLMKKEA